MGKIFREQIVSAMIGGVITILLAIAAWMWGGIYNKIENSVATSVFEQFDYKSLHSEEKIQHVTFSCPNNMKLTAASCIEHDSKGYLQTAITTIENDGSVSCNRYGGDPNAKVMATAICLGIRGH